MTSPLASLEAVLALAAEATRLERYKWRYEGGAHHYDKWFSANLKADRAAVNFLRTHGAELLAEVEGLRVDKARLDWLEARMVEIHKPNGRRDVCGAQSGLRRFVDALRGEGE